MQFLKIEGIEEESRQPEKSFHLSENTQDKPLTDGIPHILQLFSSWNTMWFISGEKKYNMYFIFS